MESQRSLDRNVLKSQEEAGTQRARKKERRDRKVKEWEK